MMACVRTVSHAPVGLLILSTLLFGCAGEDGRSNSEGTGISSVGEGSGGTTDAVDETDADARDDGPTTDGSTTDGDDATKFDLGELPGDGDGDTMDEGCQKVDLLFVIDNSGSMEDEQASLVASFGGFVTGIQAALDTADSYHVGVVTTDSYDDNANGCTGLGALVTSTGGTASSNSDCLPFSSGARYLDNTEPDLTTKFSCIAQVGISGSGDEIQAQAGYQAVSPALAAPGACNAGFIRDDALLVVVIITDEDDEEDCIPLFGCSGGSDGNPPDWAAKFSPVQGRDRGEHRDPRPRRRAQQRLRRRQLRPARGPDQLVCNGSVGDICAPSYEGFFNDAIAVIDDACTNFTPPG